jgi:hypothetical protein
MRQLLGVLFAVTLTVPHVCRSQQTSDPTQPNSDQTDFRTAADKPDAAQRVTALEQFLAGHPQTALKLDTLELLVWNSRTGASLADLEHWTSRLLDASPQNPLAAAVILGDSLPIAKPQAPADHAKTAISALDHFDRPEGMSHDDFAAMKNYVIATLNGVVGYSYFEQKDFAAARPYLRKSANLFPDNAQIVYTLALCDLQGSREDQAEGFRYLARSVNLTRGTPAGDTLATFARNQYVGAGGTSAQWDGYLAAEPVAPRVSTPAAIESASAAPTKPALTPTPSNSAAASSTANSSPAPTTATAHPPAPSTNSVAESRPASPASTNSSVATPATRTATAVPPRITASGKPSAKTADIAMATPPPPPPPSKPAYSVMPPRHIPQLVPGAPMSIGLLIQSALAQKGTRQPLVYDLTDMVRRLHPYDEAFVMSFSKGMVFQEDLTSDDKALQDAMDSIAPQQGSAIYDAVTFAAGHLNRIARNPNRVLIVLAGEGDRSSEVSPLELSSQLNVSGVRIYCIGLDIASASDQARLQQLAAYTGGRAFFINGSAEIRSAIRSISGDLGILYPN